MPFISFGRTAALFVATGLLGVALACPGGKCSGDCDKHASAAAASTTDVASAAGTKTTFTVAGMKCGSCADKVQTALLGVPGVNAASVDFSTGKAQVAYDPGKAKVESMTQAVAALGHFSATEDVKKN